MTFEQLALAACFVMVVVVVVDWRRGRTGLGRLRLDKKTDSDRYWMAMCLYLNMAFGLYWLSSKVEEPATIASEGEVIILTEEGPA